MNRKLEPRPRGTVAGPRNRNSVGIIRFSACLDFATQRLVV